MKLTDAERAKLAAAIKHFEALQKRYTRQHNGTACEYVRLALIGLKRMEQEPDVVRCGECKHGSPVPADKRRFVTSDKVLACACWRGDYDMRSDLSLTWDDGYCDEGERRKEPDDG